MKFSQESEWSGLLKAQDVANKQAEQEEKHLRSLAKELYKQQLDQQLKAKPQRPNSDAYAPQFFAAQSKALALADSQRRLEARQQQQLLAKENERQQQLRIRQARAQREIEKGLENKRIHEEVLSELSKLESERVLKQDKARRQREQLRLQVLDKQQRKEQERQQDLQFTSQASPHTRNSFHSLYANRLVQREQQSAHFTPTSFIPDRSSAYYQANDEYNRRKESERSQKEREQATKRSRDREELKAALWQQVSDKKEVKRRSQEESAQYQRTAVLLSQQQAEEDQRKLFLKRRQQVEFRRNLSQQIEDNRVRVQQQATMTDRERSMHKSLLDKLHSQHKLSFPGIPGSHNAESHLHKQIHRVYGPSSRQFVHRTPSPRRSALFRDNPYLQIDLAKHDPILNPIGSPHLSGQRLRP